MKKIILIFAFVSLLFSLSAQRDSRIHLDRYRAMHQALRFKLLGGYILPITGYGTLPKESPSFGAEIGYEFFTNNNKDWTVQWRRPIFGIALQTTYLGNPKEMGWEIALYPYVRWELLTLEWEKNRNFVLSARLGLGLAAMTETNPFNTSHFGFFGNFGLEGHFKLTDYDWIMLEIGFQKTNNGRLYSKHNSPNISPIVSLGYSFHFGGYQERPTNEHRSAYTRGLPYDFMLDIGMDAGFRDKDQYSWKDVPVKTSLHIGYLSKITNCWATGVGLDVDIVARSEESGLSFDKRFRPGIAWSNKFTMNRFRILFDWGLFIYDPERPSKYFYEYNILFGRHAWNYYRVGVGWRLYDNLVLQIVIHSQGFRCDYTGFGLSYEIPFKMGKFVDGKTRKSKNYQIWHEEYGDGIPHNYIHKVIE